MAAAAPMTVAMAAIRRLLPPPYDREALPPRQITDEAVERVGAEEELDEGHKQALTALSHFGYGAAMGATYERVLGGKREPTAANGALFGLAVWGVSYLGWLPALDFSPAAPREPAERNSMMVVSHLVWGGVTGWLLSRFPDEL
jgi:hypothetical protein